MGDPRIKRRDEAAKKLIGGGEDWLLAASGPTCVAVRDANHSAHEQVSARSPVRPHFHDPRPARHPRCRPRAVVDGKQHYSAEDGRADVKRYAEMVYADRELKLSGYEVFRFGGGELGDQAQADRIATGFFPSLFERFGVDYTP